MTGPSQPSFSPRRDIEQPQQFSSGRELAESYRSGLLEGSVVYVPVGRDEDEFDEPLTTYKATVVSVPNKKLSNPIIKVWDAVDKKPSVNTGTLFEASALELFTTVEVRDVIRNDNNSIADVPIDALVGSERYNMALAIALRAAAAQRMLDIRLTDAAVLASLDFEPELY